MWLYVEAVWQGSAIDKEIIKPIAAAYVESMIDVAIGEYADTAEYIIPSSTQGSTKKFKITVDDTGTLSATEITTTS